MIYLAVGHKLQDNVLQLLSGTIIEVS